MSLNPKPRPQTLHPLPSTLNLECSMNQNPSPVGVCKGAEGAKEAEKVEGAVEVEGIEGAEGAEKLQGLK